MLSATPRLPDDDSTSIDPGRSVPLRSAASTIAVAAFSLTEPAKFMPSHFKNSDCPKTDSRSTYRSCSLKSWGEPTTVMMTFRLVQITQEVVSAASATSDVGQFAGVGLPRL